MASVTTMSSAKLASLKNGPSINVLFRETQTSELVMLREGFPKQLAITFSGLCRHTFPPLTGMSVADLSKPRSNSLILVGGRIEAHRAVLSWMLACCEGRGMQRFPHIHRRRFWNYTCVLESADALQVEVLQDALWKRLEEIAKHQVHSEDVQAVYALSEKGNPMRAMAAESIGRALLEHGLVAKPAYTALRQNPRFKDFDHDVNEAIQRMKKEYAESEECKAARSEKQAARKRATEAAAKRYQQRQNNPRNLTNIDVSQHLDVPAEAVRSEGDGTFKVTVSTEVVRKGRKGRGRYAALPLRQAGVTAEAFRPRPEPAPLPPATRPAASKKKAAIKPVPSASTGTD